jgi:hypothetical protein
LAVNAWHRRAAQVCHLSVVLVPKDSFALPTDTLSDPLRCPLWVPLDVNVSAVRDQGPFVHCAQAIDENTPAATVDQLRHIIMHRFGFVPMNCATHCTAAEYIHVCGGMFVCTPPATKERVVGFQWTWNHLLSHRWRTNRCRAQRASRSLISVAERPLVTNAISTKYSPTSDYSVPTTTADCGKWPSKRTNMRLVITICDQAAHAQVLRSLVHYSAAACAIWYTENFDWKNGKYK